jgi:transcriptional regulator of acetoin/glycerol metabolism
MEKIMEDHRSDIKLNIAAIEEAIMLGIGINICDIFKEAENKIMRLALGQTMGNVSAAAKLLGINRTTLHERIRRGAI